jgi:hypothetical protein
MQMGNAIEVIDEVMDIHLPIQKVFKIPPKNLISVG